MNSPVIDGGAEKQAAQPGPTTSHAHFVAAVGAVLKEAGWALKETAASLFRGIVALWSLARQRRLETRRREALQDVGAQLRQGSVPESLRALSTACDRCEDEIKKIHDTAGSPAAGGLSGLKRRARLKRAQWARKLALEKLGEAGTSSLASSDRDPLRSIDVAISAEKARRTELWQPWRTLPFLRRAEVASLAMLLAAGAFFSVWRSISVTTPESPAKMFESDGARVTRQPQPVESRLPAQTDVAAGKTASDKERTQNAKLAFERERRSAPSGRWLVYSAGPVLQPGDVNQWDDFKVGSPVVIKEGKTYRMWYRGCHFVLSVYTCGIGHANSIDGVSWTRSAGPVFVPADAHENRRLNSLTIVRTGEYYWMWYSVDPDRFTDHPYATIHLATSKDGLSWKPGGPVLRALSRWTPTLEPAAFFDGKLFHLWYTDYPTDDDRTLVHATSANAAQWQTVASTAVDKLKVRPGKLSVLSLGSAGYRAVFSYAAREQSKEGIFGTLVSGDGNEWRRADSEVKLRSAALEREQLALAPAALAAPDGLWVWFTGRPENGAEEVRLAFLREGPS